MSKPDKAGQARRIDIDNPDQVVLLALSALFAAVSIARGDSARMGAAAIARSSVECANALIDAAVAKPDKP